MKFKEYISENNDTGLIGAQVNNELYFAPREHFSGAFYCSYQPLTSLKGAPRRVIGNFECVRCDLTSLEGAPEYVEGSFECQKNELKTLVGGPTNVLDGYFCQNNKLTTLKGCAPNVTDFNCADNVLTSLDYAPEFITNSIDCTGNKITSLKNIHLTIKHIGDAFYGMKNPLKSHVLGLILIEGLQYIEVDSNVLQKILNKYRGKGRQGVVNAQAEMIEAGYPEFAQL